MAPEPTAPAAAEPARAPNPADELFVFVHMPKTGGQSLRDYFHQRLEPHRTFIHLGHAGVRQATELKLRPFESRPPEERALARIILGHYVNQETHKLVPNKAARHVFFVREPARTLISYYNFQMHQQRRRGLPEISFEAWYDTTKQDNMMVRWVMVHFLQLPSPQPTTRRDLNTVQAALKSFWFVGCTETLDQDVPLLFERMGLGQDQTMQRTNVAGVHYRKALELDPALESRLRADNPLDVELYEYWRAHLPKSRQRLAAEIAAMTVRQGHEEG